MPAGDCLLQAGILLLPSFSCLFRRHVFSLAGGTPAPPVSLLIHQGACRPLDPLLLEKFVWSQGLSVSLALCATFFTTELRLRHLLLRHVFSLAGEAPAPPVSFLFSFLIYQEACRPLDPLLLKIGSWAY